MWTRALHEGLIIVFDLFQYMLIKECLWVPLKIFNKLFNFCEISYKGHTTGDLTVLIFFMHKVNAECKDTVCMFHI
jgi:hypothetical protein